MTLELHATPEEVMRAVDALREFGLSHGVPEQSLFGLTLALEECASNVVNHALKRDAGRTFLVSMEYNGNALALELRDRGPAFDPTQAHVSAATAEDERPPGGWGIQLVRRYMDEIHYRRETDQNILRLTKRLAQESGHHRFTKE
jgi:anti-sigma regulatory factor (Ser/Thr protein kinase)